MKATGKVICTPAFGSSTGNGCGRGRQKDERGRPTRGRPAGKLPRSDRGSGLDFGLGGPCWRWDDSRAKELGIGRKSRFRDPTGSGPRKRRRKGVATPPGRRAWPADFGRPASRPRPSFMGTEPCDIVSHRGATGGGPPGGGCRNAARNRTQVATGWVRRRRQEGSQAEGRHAIGAAEKLTQKRTANREKAAIVRRWRRRRRRPPTPENRAY